ncbi:MULTISPECIES: hypothetical protein [Clostridium]|uniref:Uncharacterized protein n=1 Tax=Clostridium sartagoforme AAU1 TaxID=1202534 RepID=R9BUZ1_9CLOT|nr:MULTISPECIES: hypothetical protein [Clostridium]EOR20853.1 hypothetical protein A500_15260 [Clostridium sartagoforme AAU1]KLE14687.1 hypothetical protein AAT22_15375 [Clostridium sp. C8]
MKNDENKILFKEITSYEEAYFYNSAPEDRKIMSEKNENIKRKDNKFKKFIESAAGEVLEGAVEILFSILD